MEGSMSLGRFISLRRNFMGLTQEEMAEKVGVSKSAIAKWETDGGLPDRDNLLRLAEVIGVSVDELHRIIRGGSRHCDDPVNITGDVIGILESYGYKVIPPGDGDDELKGPASET